MKKAISRIPALLLDVGKMIIKILTNKRFWIALGIIVFLYLYAWFFSNFTVNSPIKSIKFQPIIQLRYNVPPKAEKPLKTPKTAKLVASVPVEVFDERVVDIIAKVRILESGNGKAGHALYCKEKGMVNNVGYLVTPDFCFPDEDTEILTLSRWFSKRLAKMDIDSALCLYNTGTVQPMCQYSVKYHSL